MSVTKESEDPSFWKDESSVNGKWAVIQKKETKIKISNKKDRNQSPQSGEYREK